VTVGVLAPLLISRLLAGQVVAPPAEDLLGRTVVDATIEGVEPDSVPEAAAVLGQPLTRALVRALVEALWATDRYRDVQVRARPVSDGVHLVVSLEERRRIRSLEAEGNDHLDLRELRRVAGFVPDVEEHPDVLGEMRGRLEAEYAARGYPNASVSFRVESTSETGRIVLVAEIDEGEPTRIASVRLVGALVYPEHMLHDVLGVRPGDPWDQVEVGEAARRLARFYRDAGHLLVRVADPVAVPREDGRVDIDLAVEPGLPVRIVFGGNEHVGAAELLGLTGLDEQAEFSPTELGTACDHLAARYHGLGFPFAAAAWDVVEGDAVVPPPVVPGDDPPGWSAGAATADPFGRAGGGGRDEPFVSERVLFLRFRIHEGPRLRVDRIAWVGNEHFADDELSGMVFENVAAAIDLPSAWRPLSLDDLAGAPPAPEEGPGRAAEPRLPDWDPEEVYLESAYREAAVRIEERYRSEGYLDARVAALPPAEDRAAGALRPAFQVAEGTQSILRSLRVVGNAAIETEDLEDVFEVEPEDPVNELLVEQTRTAIVDLYSSRGYLFARVDREVAFSADRALADVTFVVTEGPLVRVRAIEVTGNAETETSLILGTLSFAAGDVFTPEAARESEGRLLRMGIFQGVTIGLVAPDAVAADKTISVQVREHPPQSLELRAGFSTGEGARASLAYGYHNLFGYAVGLHLRLKLNYQLFFLGNETYETNFHRLSLQDQLERLIVAGVSVPYLPGLGGLLGTQLDLTNERDNEPFYGIDRSSAFLGLSTGWRKLLSLSVRGGVEYNDVLRFEGDFPLCTGDEPAGTLCLRPEDARRLRTPQGTSTFGVVRATFAVDWRDDPFNPTRGIYASATAEWVRSFEPIFDPETGTSPFSNLIKASFVLSTYAPLSHGLVLALSGRYGHVFQLQPDSRTFADRYFYLGGSDTLRGFPQESVSVADAPAGIPSPGGDVFVVFRGELRVPFGDTFGAALFSDIGNLWRDPGSIDLSWLRYTAGLGLRIQTPIGPLAFDYGINFDRREDWGEEFGALHFSIGMF
jgi:outer membrane protein assembly factor BamA